MIWYASSGVSEHLLGQNTCASVMRHVNLQSDTSLPTCLPLSLIFLGEVNHQYSEIQYQAQPFVDQLLANISKVFIWNIKVICKPWHFLKDWHGVVHIGLCCKWIEKMKEWKTLTLNMRIWEGWYQSLTEKFYLKGISTLLKTDDKTRCNSWSWLQLKNVNC